MNDFYAAELELIGKERRIAGETDSQDFTPMYVYVFRIKGTDIKLTSPPYIEGSSDEENLLNLLTRSRKADNLVDQALDRLEKNSGIEVTGPYRDVAKKLLMSFGIK